MAGNTPQYTSSLFNEYVIAFEGSSVACILYGVYLVISGVNISLLRERRHRVILSITIAQLALTTLYMAISLYAAPAQSLGIFNIIDTYGGPDVLSSWPAILVDCTFALNTWVSDAFLLYRCYVVWMGNKYVVAAASVFYVATFGSSLAWLVVSCTPGAVYSTHSVQVTGISYFSCSAAMNIFVSCLISVRLWTYRKAILKAVDTQRGVFFLSYIAMTLESAILYAVFAITALIVFMANSPFQNVFFPVLGNVQVIAPALIIHRIARGISFEADEHGNVTASSMRFASCDQTKSFPNPSGAIRSGKADLDRSNSSILDETRDDV